MGEGRVRAGDDGAGEGLRVARRARADVARRRLRRGPLHRQGHRDVKLVLEEPVDVPALAEPPRTLLVRLKPEASIVQYF